MEPSIAGPFNARCGECLYWEQHDKFGTMGEWISAIHPKLP